MKEYSGSIRDSAMRMIAHRLLGTAFLILALANQATSSERDGAGERETGGRAPVPGIIEVALDGAARCTVSQSYAEALDSLGSSTDSLRVGIVACYADEYGRATEFLRCSVDNELLEWFRLYYRALALRRLNRYRESAVVLDSLLVLSDRCFLRKSESGYQSARVLSVDVIVHDDSLFQVKNIAKNKSSLPPRAGLLLSEALAERGQDSLAASLFIANAPSIRGPAPDTLLMKLYARFTRLYQGMSAGDLRSLAKAALRNDLNAEAAEIIRLLLARDGGDYEALLLRGSLLANEDSLRKALRLYNRVAVSRAPRRVKMDALAKAAALEYRLGHLERAIKGYRTLAAKYSVYPYYDLAARVDLSLGKYEEALEFWRRHEVVNRQDDFVQSDAHGTSVAPFVPICRASLLHWLGRDREAHRVLTDMPGLARRDDGSEAARFYWLSRTAPSDSEQAFWTSALALRYPHSLYEYAQEHGVDSLPAALDSLAQRSRIEAMVGAERRLIDSLGVRVREDDAFLQILTVRAYTYFIDRGLLGEARECVHAIKNQVDPREPYVFELYRRARIRGFCDFAIWIINGPFVGRMPDDLQARLEHPVPFADILADTAATSGLAPELILAVMHAESKFAVNAVSSDGAAGLMQLMPATARWIVGTDADGNTATGGLFDPEYNIRAGSRYLAYLVRRCDRSLVGALAAFNAGEGKISRWRRNFDPARNPMVALEMIGPAETKQYVKNVLEALCVYRTLAQEGAERK